MTQRASKRGHPRLLFVEGDEDKRFVPWLVEGGCDIAWERDGSVVVYIEAAGGVDAILRPGKLAAELRDSRREAVGVVIDADIDPRARWQAVRDRLSRELADLDPRCPEQAPEQGFIATVDADAPRGPIRLGVWMMPDNRAPGMVQTLARALTPMDSAQPLHDLAEQSCDQAAQLGAPFRPTHRDKAVIHTWLAWQDPPGRQLHDAIKQRMLDPTLPQGQAFIRCRAEPPVAPEDALERVLAIVQGRAPHLWVLDGLETVPAASAS